MKKEQHIKKTKYFKLEIFFAIAAIAFAIYVKLNTTNEAHRYPAGYPSQLILKHNEAGDVFIIN
ncbi:hypothetical protein ABMA79_07715 [Halobacteriovorax sp. HFRX-2_2]|uniref:hypothetical protein n=1 Tax=unclassified Halobacteriovorax TaxID=2639665 RepID=UPI00371D944A